MKKLPTFLKTKNGKITTVVLVLIAIVVVVGLVNNSGTSGCPSPAGQADMTISGKMLHENAHDYRCKVVTLSGKVFNTDKSGSKNAWQVWTDAENSSNDVIVYLTGTSNIGNDDYVTFTGQIGDSVSGQNAFGGNVAAPAVYASSIQKVGRDQAVAPALKTISPNLSQTQSGVTVTIQKIEYAAQETRVFISVKNDSSANANIYTYETRLVQGSSQVKDKTIFDNSSSKDLPSEIVPNTIESAKMYFEKADFTKPITITFSGISEAGDYPELHYSFTIKP